MSRVRAKPAIGNWKRTARRKVKKGKSKPHRDFINSLACVICGEGSPECAHVRYADAERGKPESGMGRKPPDKYVVPLCAEHHRTGPEAQHNSNERLWWAGHGIDPIALAERLWEVSGDYEAGMQIIMGIRNG